MVLTPRLALAARLCAGGQHLIDVGCDHGYLSIHLVARGGFRSALACDVRPGPLQRARANIAAAGLEPFIATRLGDGLSGITPRDGDTVALCGMGGGLMIRLLAAAPWVLAGGHTLVLQPQTKAEDLRAFLWHHGCAIKAEGLAREGRRLYTVLQARGGAGSPVGEPAHGLFSRALTDDPLFPLYLDAHIARLRRAVAGRLAGELEVASESALLEALEGLRRSYK